MREFDPEQALKALREQYEDEFFVAGNCHHLALALYEAAGNTGHLLACIRHQTDAETGQVYMSSYSHMMYQSPDGAIWDIDGQDADTRWGAQFENLTDPDEDNLLSEFEWRYLQAEDVPVFVTEWDACFDRAVVNAVKAKISAATQLAATP